MIVGCCETMHSQLNYDCVDHGTMCPDVVVVRNLDYDYFLRAANANYACYYCPWCGQDLAEFHGLGRHSETTGGRPKDNSA